MSKKRIIISSDHPVIAIVLAFIACYGVLTILRPLAAWYDVSIRSNIPTCVCTEKE